MTALTQSRLRELLSYDPETGEWAWRVKVGVAGGVRNPGDKATYLNGNGQVRMSVDGAKYLASRMAWLYMTGELVKEIDHRDLNPANNRWKNLRAATRSQNSANTRARSNNKLGVKGVCWDKKQQKFQANITLNGKQRGLGRFDSLDEARAAYAAAAEEAFGEFART